MSHFNKAFGVFSDGGELSGLLATEELAGLLALEKLAGLLALEELAGLLALEELAGLLALEELSGLLSVDELSGSVDNTALADEAADPTETVEFALSEEPLELPGAGSGSADDTVLWLSGRLGIGTSAEIFSRIFSRSEQPVIRTMLAASTAASCILNFLIIIY